MSLTVCAPNALITLRASCARNTTATTDIILAVCGCCSRRMRSLSQPVWIWATRAVTRDMFWWMSREDGVQHFQACAGHVILDLAGPPPPIHLDANIALVVEQQNIHIVSYDIQSIVRRPKRRSIASRMAYNSIHLPHRSYCPKWHPALILMLVAVFLKLVNGPLTLKNMYPFAKTDYGSMAASTSSTTVQHQPPLRADVAIAMAETTHHRPRRRHAPVKTLRE